MSPSSTEYTGAMIALVPSDADLDRLAIDGGEPRDELHLTLWYLGDAVDLDFELRRGLVNAVTSMVERRDLPIVRARAFGVAHWNPASDDPAWVLNVGDVPPDERDNEPLGVVKGMMHEAWFDGGVPLQVPPQHTPWQPHVCVAYSSDDLGPQLESLLGDVTFDRVRVTFGDEVMDVSLTSPGTVVAGLGGDVVPWHKTHNHADCPAGKPWAVVKDATGEVAGCHASEADADAQLAALYANEGDAKCVDCASADVEHDVTLAAVSDAPWDGSSSRFTDDEYRRAAASCDSGDEPPKSRCFLPHHEPGGALNRSAVHNAAARLNQLTGHSSEAVARAKSHLRSHYRQLGEEVPDVLKASAEDHVTAVVEPIVARYGDKSDCPPGHHLMPDGSCMSDDEMANESRWCGVLVVEGTPTGDGREFAPNALSWAEHALLRWQKEGSHGGDHDVTVSVGRIDEVWRVGNQVVGRGVLNLLSDDGFEVWRRMKGDFAGGISIDADDISDADVEFVWGDDYDDEITEESGDVVKLLFGRPEKMIYHAGRVRAATLCDIPAFVEAHIALGDVPESLTLVADAGAAPVHQTEISDLLWTPPSAWRRNANVTLTSVGSAPAAACAWRNGDHGILPHHELTETGDVGAANLTACATAIGDLLSKRGIVPEADLLATYQHLAAHLRDANMEPQPLDEREPIIASADTWQPPRSWFEDPKLSVPIGITVTDQGRVYGHVAQWGECHIGHQDLCVTPPFEDVHPYFMTGEVLCADGSRVAVGQITVGTGHAPLQHSASRAAEHYDHTGAAVADVVVGNDDVGIWVAGAVRPSVEAARVHELRASGQVSGDWRRIGGQLRLVGLLAVNVPGFPVPRLRARVASGIPQSLVAAGRPTVAPRVVAPAPTAEELDKQAMRRVMDMLAERMRRAPNIEGVS